MWRNLGKTDIKVSPIIMGCWQAGKQYWEGIRVGKIVMDTV